MAVMYQKLAGLLMGVEADENDQMRMTNAQCPMTSALKEISRLVIGIWSFTGHWALVIGHCCHGLNKRANSPTVLFPRLALHPAGHINCTRPDPSDRLGDIFRGLTSSEDDGPPELFRRAGQLPVELCARAAQGVGHKTVQEPGIRFVSRQLQ